ncbi:MAG: hypothetical protein Athens041674_792, partial [Parcubacteria group bacterium Athens0416_74]
LLGHIGQKGGDEKHSYRERALEAKERDASPVLLGRLHASLIA